MLLVFLQQKSSQKTFLEFQHYAVVSDCHVNQGEPFWIRAHYDPSDYLFIVTDHFGGKTYFDMLPLASKMNMDKLTLTGDADINVLGFIPYGN